MVILESDCSGVKPESPPQMQQGESPNNPLFPVPIRQNSAFSLDLDEFQLRSLKNFGSMNIDDFMNNLWNGDDNLLLSLSRQNESNNDKIMADQTNPPQQESFSIPTELCKKTMDEVWADIHKDEQQQQQQSNNNDSHESVQRQQTLGEITLEDFLVKAGIVGNGSGSSQHHMLAHTERSGSFPDHNTNLETTFGIGNMMGLSLPGSQNSGDNSTGNGLKTFLGQGKKFPGESSNSMAEVKGDGAPELGGQRGRKRIADGTLEMAMERRQRRMIKNRESAARSRARKQAYTVELELELNQLKEENAKLKQIVAEADHKRREKLMAGKATTKAQKIAEQLRTLRRTVSGP